MKLTMISCQYRSYSYGLLFTCLLSLTVCQIELNSVRSSTEDESPHDSMSGLKNIVASESTYDKQTAGQETILPNFFEAEETVLQKLVISESTTVTDKQMTYTVLKDNKQQHYNFDGGTDGSSRVVAIDGQTKTTQQNGHAGDGRHIMQESEQTRKEITDENQGQKQTIESSSDGDSRDANISNLTDDKSWLNWIRHIIDPVFEEFKDDSTLLQNDTVLNETTTAVNNSIPVNISSSVELNSTDLEEPNNSTDWGKKKFQCKGRNMNNSYTVQEVKIVNNTVLLQMLNFERNETDSENNTSDCILVLFFAPWCHFCAKTAPHYNALARAFPQLDVLAIDAAHFSNLNARFGTVSVPNILLFHQSRAVIRFNQTDRNFDALANFIKNATGLEPNTTVNVTEADYLGPLSSVPAEESDYLLWLAWVFVISFSSYMVIQSTRGQHWINKVRILWQEHQHID
ncbi:hypothetical protein CHS0354_028351 [Potamilus streckersoni]|uniref:Thioredoxin domain-containing protein n=1 Tax=Potamilus streckersoni TaxID=2493646 RepID=A0AAE0RTS9_9BIVA|nr:hypothetical protein CHS0354_028351 [Potamilus streckersoni]